MPKQKTKPEPLPIAEVDKNTSQNKLAAMLEKSGYKSRFLEKLAGKRED